MAPNPMTPAHSRTIPTRQEIWLYRYACFWTAGTLILILAGGLVTSHEAGLAVPDWPLSYGRFFPPMVGNIFWEHGHRMIAATVGILTLILAVWVQFQEKRSWLKKLAWISFGTVLTQALLGGLTVIFLLPPAISVFHACLAQTFFCLTFVIAEFLNPAPAPVAASPAESGRDRLKPLAIMTTGFLYLQLVLGALLRHTGHGLPFHILNAFLVGIHVMLLTTKTLRLFGGDKTLPRAALMLGALTVVQFFLGIGAFVFTKALPRGGYAPEAAEIIFTTSHQTLGALILATSLFLAVKAPK